LKRNDGGRGLKERRRGRTQKLENGEGEEGEVHAAVLEFSCKRSSSSVRHSEEKQSGQVKKGAKER